MKQIRVTDLPVVECPRSDVIKVAWMRDGTVWELKAVHGKPIYEGGPPAYKRVWYAVVGPG